MVPPTIAKQLSRLRTRERALQVAWTAARWLAVCAALLAGACLLDFVIDRRRDTPQGLRVTLLAVQAVFWSAGAFFVLGALLRRWDDAGLALWVEDKLGTLRHRLVSAVQLNRAGARTAGMSPELIAATTRQAEHDAARHDFAALADGRRAVWSAAVVGPLVLALIALFLWVPDTLRALVARQFLADRAIPRAVELRDASAAVWPAGEDGELRFLARGKGVEAVDPAGEVLVEPEDGSAPFRLELKRAGTSPDGVTYTAKVPPSGGAFAFRAWLGDGRTRAPGRVRYEPRPVVQKVEAWVQLPAKVVGTAPGGRPYEEPQSGGDVVHRLDGSEARVVVTAQKPIARGRIELLRVAGKDGAVTRSFVLDVKGDGRTAGATFPLDSRRSETAYRVVVEDEHGFGNAEPPRRALREGAVDPPEVALLPEVASDLAPGSAADDREIEGIPVLLGGRFRLDYACAARYGLRNAQLRFRVIRAGTARDGESAAPDPDTFLRLPLGPSLKPGAEVSAEARRQFTALPPPGSDQLPATRGGGRYDFSIAGIPDADGKGGRLTLNKGDRVQFFVEVFGKADGPPGRSAVREKEVVDREELLAWMERKDDLKERIKQLEDRQRSNPTPAGGEDDPDGPGGRRR